MPTIDQLAPATACSDTDEMLASQNGAAVKVTRAQVVAGLQPALAIPAGTILGRASSGVGAPEALSVGANLVINGGTLSATTAYTVSTLPPGTAPEAGDLVAMGQGGINTAVPYSQFTAGIFAVPGLNASQMLVTPTGASVSQKLADFAASALPTTGGTMTGALMLAANPVTALQAAPKQYVDENVAAALPVAGGTMRGALTLAADPVASLQAATKDYVDSQAAAALPRTGGTMTGALALAADPVASSQAATKHYVDTQVQAALPIAGGVMSGMLTLAANPTTALQAVPKQYADALAATALPVAGGTMAGPLTLAADPTASLQAATKEYVDAQVVTALPKAGGTMTGLLALAGDPVASSQAATKHYVDGQILTALPIAGGTMTGALTLSANPATALQAAPKQYVDAQVASVTSALPSAPLVGASGGKFTSVTLPSGGGLTLNGSSLSITPNGVDFSGGNVTPSDTGTATTLAAAIGARLSRTGDASASTVIATGGTIARTLAARFADEFNAKNYGAKGDGVTDDTSAIERWLTAASSIGGTAYAPSGNYILSSSLIQTIAGVSVNIRGDGPGNTKFTFTGATNGVMITLSRTSGAWGAVRISDITIVRNPTSPAQANTGLSIVADPTAGIQYFGNTGISDVNLDINGTAAWLTGVRLQSLVNCELRNVRITGPVPAAAGSDAAISVGGTASMFSSSVMITDCILEGYSNGLSVGNYVQGVLVENSTILANYYNIYWAGALPPVAYPATAATTAGNPLQVGTVTAALLNVGMLVNGANIAPQSVIASINTATGSVVLNPPTSGTVTSGQTITFQAPTGCEELNVSNCTFSAAICDIYLQYVSLSTITGSTLIRFLPNPSTPLSSTWAGIGLQDGNNNIVSGNTILGSFQNNETGIYNSTQAAGLTKVPNSIIGNTVSSLSGAGIVLGGIGPSLTGGLVANTTVIGNVTEGVSAGVVSNIENANTIFGNQYNDNPPDITTSTRTGAFYFNYGNFTFGNNNTSNLQISLNSSGGGGNINFQQAGLDNWLLGGNPSSFGIARYVTPGALTDIPFSIDNATGSVALLHNLTIGGTFIRTAMASSTPSSGIVVGIPPGISDYRILGSATLPSLTVELPASPANGLAIRVSSQIAITTLTVRDQNGGTGYVQAAPVTLAAGGGFSAQWNSAASAWWCSVGS